eukprot:4096723-Pyramimonas_sp.AAC.1
MPAASPITASNSLRLRLRRAFRRSASPGAQPRWSTRTPTVVDFCRPFPFVRPPCTVSSGLTRTPLPWVLLAVAAFKAGFATFRGRPLFRLTGASGFSSVARRARKSA